MGHRHKPQTVGQDRTFSEPVAWPENPEAHGGITRIETCRCGATRAININQQYRELGRWHDPQNEGGYEHDHRSQIPG